MAERSRRAYRIPPCIASAVLFAALTAGCAPRPAGAPQAPGPAAPAPAAVGRPPAALLVAGAELLRLEDRRDYHPATLARLAGDSSGAVRARTALALGRLRDPRAAPALLRLLVDADSAVSATAAFALGQLGDSVHSPALAAALSSAIEAAPTVAAEAAYALGKTGGLTARDALGDLLRERSLADSAAAPAVGSALLAVWKLPPLEDLGAITRWLESGDAGLRWRAAYALVRRPDARALPYLRRLLADPDPRVRAQAVRGLTAAAADSAGVPRGMLVGEIIPLLHDSAYPVPINAARVLGGYTGPAAVDALAGAAAGSNRHLAIAALEALGRIGAEAAPAAPVLGAMARTDSLPLAIRTTALEALAHLDRGAAEEAASRFAASPSWRLRAAAARASATMAGALPPPLRDGLADSDPRVANAALQAAVEAAGADPAVLRPLLLSQLGSSDVIVRSTALATLARIPDPSLLPVLLDAYARAQRDTLNDAALAAVDAIGAISGDRLAPTRAFLARFERSPDPLVRLRAVQRLDSTAVRAAWGDPLPIETERSAAEYRRLAERFGVSGRPGGTDPEVALVTRGDTVRIRLFASEAPLTVESFLRLADSGYFDGQEWPRVVPNFVVQGGDPRGDTSGGPGYTIRDEIGRRRYGVGTVGMALAGPDTGGSQFFITHSPQPHLDGTYAIFGEVVAGQSVAEAILPGDTIDSIRSTH